jgi:hypothetical protein
MYVNAYNPVSRALIKFDLNNIETIISSVNEILNGTLYLFIEQNSASTGRINLRVRRIKKYWTDSQTTWKKASSGVTWQRQGAEGSNDRTEAFKSITVQQGQTGWVSVNVFDWVKWSYVNDQYYGFIIEVHN